jgi:hypothetical protein
MNKSEDAQARKEAAVDDHPIMEDEYFVWILWKALHCMHDVEL